MKEGPYKETFDNILICQILKNLWISQLWKQTFIMSTCSREKEDLVILI